MSALPNEVASLVIPLDGMNLLVPNSCVAEIVPNANPEPRSGDEPWFTSRIVWRDLSLPCISFEKLSEQESAPSQSTARVAIFNTLDDDFSMRFYALAINGIPRLARVIQEELVEEPAELNEYEALKVQFNGEACVIPNLKAIEALLAKTNLA